MRGLAFPPNAVFEREPSHEYGTPFPGGDQIPIDPALGGLAIDPAIMGESSTGVGRVNSFEHVPIEPPAPFPENYPAPRQISQEPPQYSQGPQGDPFAPQPSYTPMVEQPPPPNPPKKKRRPRREEECGFCEGNDQKNKAGEPELMVTCDDCGRSGHPSCMELSEIGHVMHSYAWKCADCKSCEVCHEKGDEERILFCDFCDRGWHMDCLPDPLEEQPPGRWHCPMCPPVDQHQMLYPFTEPMPGDPEPLPPELDSSQSPNYFAKGKGKHGGDEEDAVDDEIPFQLKTRNRPKSNKKAKVPKNSRVGERIVSPARPPKRMRFRFNERASLPRIRLRLPALGKGKAREDDEEHRKGIFDDILSVEERDTSKSAVEFADKQRFEKSRLAAEIKLAPPPTPVPHADEGHDPSTPGPSTRPLRSSTIQSLPIAIPTPAPSSPAPSTPGPLTKTGPSSQPPLRIRTIRFGPHDIQTWYDAPFPEEYASIPDGRMWICEFCLKYMKSRFGAGRHRMKCKARHPPGDEIYRDGAVSIFEVDGRKNKIYCQNLCLLSKMFLDHKSLFYDVEPFLFYVMTETDDNGAHFIGYFSKEKRSPKDYNVSCIMTLPNRQRKGWGNLLIDFSYLLSKKEQRLGSPEKPLSGLGAVGYKNYWTLSLMRYLDLAPDHPKLEDVSTATSMTLEDACTTLSQQGMISIRDTTPPIVRPSPGQSIKYPKGRKNGIARRHLQRVPTQDDENAATPFVVPKHYEICWSREKVTSYLTAWESKGYPKLKPEKLKWSPFLTSQIKTSEILEATEASSSVSDPLHRLPTTGLSTPKDVSTSLRGDEDGASTFTDVLPVWSTHPDNDKHAKESSSPVKVVRTEEDRLFAQELPESPSFPRRQLRSRSTRSSSVSSSTRANAARAENVTPLLNRLRRSESVRTPNMEYDAADTVIDDEAFAAKLELEERRSTRRLRSRTEVQSVDSRISSTPNSRHTSPRKRRRVDSSPEIDTPLKPVNGKRDNIPNPLTPRKSNRLANGSPPNCKPDVTMEPVAAESVVPSGNDVAMSELVETEETYKTGDAWEKSQEVKCEDIGTPLTSVTSLPHDELPTPADTNSLPVSNNFEKEQQSGPAIPDALEAEEADVYGEFDEDAEGEPDEDLLEVQ